MKSPVLEKYIKVNNNSIFQSLMTELVEFNRRRNKLRMKKITKGIFDDFAKSETLKNAMNLSAEFHNAQVPELPKPKFKRRRAGRLDRLLTTNSVDKQ